MENKISELRQIWSDELEKSDVKIVVFYIF